MNQVIRIFPDTFMGKAHKGLRFTAETYDVDLDRLSAGELVIFLSTRGTAMKCWAGIGDKSVIGYFKNEDNSILQVEDVANFSIAFGGQSNIKFTPKVLTAFKAALHTCQLIAKEARERSISRTEILRKPIPTQSIRAKKRLALNV